MGLEKLTIKVVQGRAVKPIVAHFNPEEYSVNKDNNFAVQPIPGLAAPIVQYVNGNLRTLEMELFFDTWDNSQLRKVDVRDITNRVVQLMDIDPELHAPPILEVSWSSLQFTCVLARCSQKFVMFADTGWPVRARLTCTFNEIIDPDHEAKRVNKQTADFTKVHIVAEGETLASIAASRYDDPRAWRPIAVANHLTDPRKLAIGQSLLIPSLPFLDPVTREVVA